MPASSVASGACERTELANRTKVQYGVNKYSIPPSDMIRLEHGAAYNVITLFLSLVLSTPINV